MQRQLQKPIVGIKKAYFSASLELLLADDAGHSLCGGGFLISFLTCPEGSCWAWEEGAWGKVQKTFPQPAGLVFDSDGLPPSVMLVSFTLLALIWYFPFSFAASTFQETNNLWTNYWTGRWGGTFAQEDTSNGKSFGTRFSIFYDGVWGGFFRRGKLCQRKEPVLLLIRRTLFPKHFKEPCWLNNFSLVCCWVSSTTHSRLDVNIFPQNSKSKYTYSHDKPFFLSRKVFQQWIFQRKGDDKSVVWSKLRKKHEKSWTQTVANAFLTWLLVDFNMETFIFLSSTSWNSVCRQSLFGNWWYPF